MINQATKRALINQSKPRHALSRELYCNPNVYQDDLEQIWHKEWTFYGHSFEIELSEK